MATSPIASSPSDPAASHQVGKGSWVKVKPSSSYRIKATSDPGTRHDLETTKKIGKNLAKPQEHEENLPKSSSLRLIEKMDESFSSDSEESFSSEISETLSSNSSESIDKKTAAPALSPENRIKELSKDILGAATISKRSQISKEFRQQPGAEVKSPQEVQAEKVISAFQNAKKEHKSLEKNAFLELVPLIMKMTPDATLTPEEIAKFTEALIELGKNPQLLQKMPTEVFQALRKLEGDSAFSDSESRIASAMQFVYRSKGMQNLISRIESSHTAQIKEMNKSGKKDETVALKMLQVENDIMVTMTLMRDGLPKLASVLAKMKPKDRERLPKLDEYAKKTNLSSFTRMQSIAPSLSKETIEKQTMATREYTDGGKTYKARYPDFNAEQGSYKFAGEAMVKYKKAKWPEV